MSAVGFAALRALLLRWTKSPLGAAVGAAVFVFSGCFAARFNAGHATYAFFHFVPLLMLWFDVALERALAGRPAWRDAAFGVPLTFAFMSGALPHALLHFYPAFALWAVWRIGAAVRAHGATRALAAVQTLLVSHALGIGLAAYKIWPIVRWQLDQPRTGVFRERYSLANVLENTLRFVPDYFDQAPQRPFFQLPNWGYNAFVGPLPWLVALLALVALGRRRAPERPAAVDPLVASYAAALVALGFWLAIGNANPAGLGSAFEHLPVLDAVRGFNRYQALIAFGVAILCAQGFAWLGAELRMIGAGRALLALGCVAPVLAQSALLVWNLPAVPRSAILARYARPTETAAEVPRQLVQVPFEIDQSGEQATLLDAGYWIANCYSPVTPARGAGPHGPVNARIPLSTPEPARARIAGRDQLVLDYPPGLTGDVRLHLRVPDGARLNVPFRRDPDSYDVVFRAEDLPAGVLELVASYPGPAAGARASAFAAGCCALYLAAIGWRARQRGNTGIVSRTS